MIATKMSRSIIQRPACKHSRRTALLSLFGPLFFAPKLRPQITQEEQVPDERKPKIPDPNEEPRLPDGKSQKNAIAKEQHDQALKDANNLIAIAQDLRDELQRAGTFIVPITAVRKTEEIEKLAKRIRSRLKS